MSSFCESYTNHFHFVPITFEVIISTTKELNLPYPI